MTDLEITKLCAEAMGIKVCGEYVLDSSIAIADGKTEPPFVWYMPLHDDTQAMALVKELKLSIYRMTEGYWLVDAQNGFEASNTNLNRAVCEYVAKMQQAKENAELIVALHKAWPQIRRALLEQNAVPQASTADDRSVPSQEGIGQGGSAGAAPEPAAGHEHCWHDTGRMLASDPPHAVEICCFCGKERSLRIKRYSPPGIHGRFSPDRKVKVDVLFAAPPERSGAGK